MSGLVEHLLAERTPLELAKELAQLAKENAALRERVARQDVELFWLKVPAALTEQALTAARAEGRAEAVLIIQSTEPETALEDCLCHSQGFDGEYDTHWDDAKLRAKFMVGDATINMETKAELAYYEYLEARMVLEWEAVQRREQAAPNFEAWFKLAAEEYRAHDREYSRKVWAAALLSCQAAPAPAADTEPAALRFFGAVADRPRTAEEAACWCHACRPVTLDDCRMVLCPTCGNKRCPRADDHRNVCSGSNEPGQVPVRETPP